MSIQRRSNSWRARYYGPDGRQRSKSFPRKAYAERWLSRGTVTSSCKATGPIEPWVASRFGEYVLAWLDSRTDLKPKTRHQYTSLLTLHTPPTWHTVPLAKVTYEGLTQWVARLSLGGLGPSGIPAVCVRHVRRT